MFRENEASRLGAVLEHKAAGNLDGMLEAAAALWRELPERDGEVDTAEREVWNALAERGLTERAAEISPSLYRKRAPCQKEPGSSNLPRRLRTTVSKYHRPMQPSEVQLMKRSAVVIS